MIYGIGIDICEVHRFERLVKKQAFLNKVFTVNEIEYCSRHGNSEQNYAARFAAKEAFVKAMGTGFGRKGISLKEIEILKDELGKPYIKLHGKTQDSVYEDGDKNILLSISHEEKTAVAVVIIENEK